MWSTGCIIYANYNIIFSVDDSAICFGNRDQPLFLCVVDMWFITFTIDVLLF